MCSVYNKNLNAQEKKSKLEKPKRWKLIWNNRIRKVEWK